MIFLSPYISPLGPITLAASEIGITGVWFDGQKYDRAGLPTDVEKKMTPVLENAIHWLNLYFFGKVPDFTPPLDIPGTPFRHMISEIMLEIPYGHTMTYAAIALEAARRLGRKSMSAQAVGGAVGRNTISLIVPCHRVIGSGGNLTGYAGGIERKLRLLELEGHRVSSDLLSVIT